MNGERRRVDFGQIDFHVCLRGTTLGPLSLPPSASSTAACFIKQTRAHDFGEHKKKKEKKTQKEENNETGAKGVRKYITSPAETSVTLKIIIIIKKGLRPAKEPFWWRSRRKTCELTYKFITTIIGLTLVRPPLLWQFVRHGDRETGRKRSFRRLLIYYNENSKRKKKRKIRKIQIGSLTVWDPSVTACVAESYVKFSGRKAIAHASRHRTSDGL